MSSTNVSNKTRNDITIALKFLHEARLNISVRSQAYLLKHATNASSRKQSSKSSRFFFARARGLTKFQLRNIPQNMIDGAAFIGVGFDGSGTYSPESRKKSIVQRVCANNKGTKDNYSASDFRTVQLQHSSNLKHLGKDDKTPMLRGPVFQTLSRTLFRPKYVILKPGLNTSDLVFDIHTRFWTFKPKWLQTSYPLGGT